MARNYEKERPLMCTFEIAPMNNELKLLLNKPAIATSKWVRHPGILRETTRNHGNVKVAGSSADKIFCKVAQNEGIL